MLYAELLNELNEGNSTAHVMGLVLGVKDLLLCYSRPRDWAHHNLVAKLDSDPRGLAVTSACVIRPKQTATQQHSSYEIWNY